MIWRGQPGGQRLYCLRLSRLSSNSTLSPTEWLLRYGGQRWEPFYNVRDKVTRQCPRTITSVWRERRRAEAAVSSGDCEWAGPPSASLPASTRIGSVEGGMEVGGEGDYTYRYSHSLSVTTRMTSALRWAAMRTILMFQWAGSDGQSHRTVPTNHNLSEEKGEPNQCPSAFHCPANALPRARPNQLTRLTTGLGYCVRGQGGSTRCFKGSER